VARLGELRPRRHDHEARHRELRRGRRHLRDGDHPRMKTTCVCHHGEVSARYRPRPCRHGSRERRRTRNATGEHRKRRRRSVNCDWP
jgi:hypothetical protein